MPNPSINCIPNDFNCSLVSDSTVISSSVVQLLNKYEHYSVVYNSKLHIQSCKQTCHWLHHTLSQPSGTTKTLLLDFWCCISFERPTRHNRVTFSYMFSVNLNDVAVFHLVINGSEQWGFGLNITPISIIIHIYWQAGDLLQLSPSPVKSISPPMVERIDYENIAKIDRYALNLAHVPEERGRDDICV